ncbi:MAG TPA: hypothetical protein PKY35_13300 [Candidatus Hydrogenedentes bacterium]|nr:hypothetical protein [Candidatus Hydrogenedentota bacterium]HOL77995.1 hypothetical protein [Candidatus Hydrogenedentota bacterium]HPO87085.1 hypothetical protein [Candidatus Hydrogenedentota bacterium]
MRRVMSVQLLSVLVCISALFVLGKATSAEPPDQILKNLSSPDPDVRMTAVKQAECLELADIPSLLQLIGDANFEVSRTAKMALDRVVASCGQVGKEEQKKQVTQALTDMLSSTLATEVKREILRRLGILGDDSAVAAIRKLLLDEHLGEDAKMALERIPGESSVCALVEVLPQASPQMQISILGSLKKRCPAPPPKEIFEIAQNASGDLAWAALETLAAAGTPPTAVISADRCSALYQENKTRFLGTMISAAQQQASSGNREEAEKLFLQSLAMGPKTHQCNAILNGLMDIQSRQGVIWALRWIGDPEMMPFATEVLTHTSYPNIEEYLTAAFARDKGFRRATLLRILAKRGYKDLPSLLASAEQDNSAEVRLAACEWSGKTPTLQDFREAFSLGSPLGRDQIAEFALKTAEHVLESQQQDLASELAVVVLQQEVSSLRAARAFQLIEAAAAPAAFDLLSQIFGFPFSGKERGADGNCPPPFSRLFTNDSSLEEKAQRAYVAVCSNLPQDKAREGLLSIARGSNIPTVVQLAGKKLEALGVNINDLAVELGYLVSWKILGPFPNESNRNIGLAILPENTEELPEEVTHETHKYSWQNAEAQGVPAVLNLENYLGEQEQCLAYATAKISLSNETQAVIHVGSDDGCIVWVNGAKVLDKPAPRKLVVNEDKIAVTLRSGLNNILAKVSQGVGDWQLCVQITDENGKPLDFKSIR